MNNSETNNFRKRFNNPEISSILEHIKDALIILDNGLRVVFINSEAECLLEKPCESVIGHDIYEFFYSTETLQKFHNYLQEVLLTKSSVEYCTLYMPQGRWVDISIDLCEAGIIILIKDISELHRSHELITALNVINNEINSTMDFDEIMNLIVVDAAKAINAESAAIFLIENDYWVTKYKYNFDLLAYDTKFTNLEAPFAAIGMRTGDVVVIHDSANDDRISKITQDYYNFNSILFSPLTVKHKVIGAYFFCHYNKNLNFSTAEIDFVKKLGISTSLALENFRLYDELRRESRKNSALESVSEAGISSFYLNEVLDEITRRITEQLDAACGVIMMMTDDLNKLYIRSEYIRDSSDCLSINISQETAGLIFHEGQTIDIIVDESENHLLGVPIVIRGSVRGAMFLLSYNKKIFDQEDKYILGLMLDRSSLIIDNINLYTDLTNSRTDIQSALNKEKGITHQLEHALMPPVPVIDPRYSLAVAYVPVNDSVNIGGDFYDVFYDNNGLINIIIGDVSGKGINAASIAVVARSTIRAFAYNINSPSMILGSANDVLCSYYNDNFGVFITVFFIILDPATGKITYSCAGHPPAVIYRHNGDIEFAYTGQPPLGIETIKFVESENFLSKGDKLLLYTDGVTEARYTDDLFGLNGIKDVLDNYGNYSPEIIASELINTARNWAGGLLRDDTALLVIERKEN